MHKIFKMKLTKTVRIFKSDIGGRRGRDRVVVGFTTTYAISANHSIIVSSNPTHEKVHSIMW